jgi:hypothetical protein
MVRSRLCAVPSIGPELALSAVAEPWIGFFFKVDLDLYDYDGGSYA